MDQIQDLRAQLEAALDRVGVPAVPVVMPTPWDVGPVAAYLFPEDPVTLVDAGVDTPEGLAALSEALERHSLEPADVKRVLVTHAHTDHFAGAIWLQKSSGCEVLVHPADLVMATNPDWQETERRIFPTIGFTSEEVERFFSHDWEWRFPEFTALQEGRSYAAGSVSLRAEHHPGHTPGHVWIIEENSGAIFVGDYVIADHPTNAGMELDESHPSGRAPLLQQYNAGLRELRDREAPMLFPAHGPPIADHRQLIDRRLRKTDRRTQSVFEALRSGPPTTALALGRRMYRDRMNANWEVVADLVGRLDLLVAEGRAAARLGEDGAWYFTAAD